MITSVEYINLNMTGTTTSGSLSKSQTIANCVPFSTISGSTGTGGNLRNFFTDVWFTDTGTPTVNIQRGNSGGTLDVGIFVVEFDPAEITVQQGSFSFSGTSTTATISGVDLDKAAMVHHHRTSTTNNGWYNHPTRCKFNNTTQIQFDRGSTGGSIDGHWYVFEDTGGINFRVQAVSTDYTGTSSSSNYNYTIRDRTFILTSYYSTDPYSGYAQRGSTRPYIYDDHRIYLDRVDGSSYIYANTFVVDFLDTTKAYTQHWWATGANDSTTLTQTMTLDYPINLNDSIVIGPTQGGLARQDGYDLTDNYGAFWHANFTSTSGIQLDRQPPNDYGYIFYQIIDWNGYVTFDGTGTNPSPISGKLIVSVEEIELELTAAVDGYRFPTRFNWQQLTKGQDVDNCVIFSSYRVTGGSGYFYEISAVTGFDGARIFTHRANNSTGTFTMHAFVVEFNPSKVNVMHGPYYFTGTSSNKTITALTDYTKAFVVSNWWSACSQQSYNFYIRNRLTSNTNIEYTRGASNNHINLYYFVVEDLGNNWTVQSRLNSFSGSSVTDSAITHVPWHNTFSITSYYTNVPYVGYAQRASIRHYHYHYNMFMLDRSEANNNIYAHSYIITFTDTSRERVHRDYLTLSNTLTTNTADLWYSIDLDSSIVQSTVQQTNVRQNGYDQADNKGVIATLEFTSVSGIDVKRTPNSETGYMMWEAIDWVGRDFTGTGTNPDPITGELIVSIENFEVEVDDRITWFELSKGQILDNCVPFVSCRPDVGMGGYLYKMLPEVWFEDPSLLYIWRSTASGKMYYNIQVIEFNPAKIKVQHGTFNFSGNSQNTTISGVDLSRTFAITYYNYNSSSQQNYYWACETSFTSSTQINLYRYNGIGWINAHFYVVEALNNEWTVQTLDNSFIGTYQDAETTSVDKSRAFSIVSSASSDPNVGYADRSTIRMYPMTSRRVRADRQTASSTIYWTAFVVEFADQTKKYVQYHNETLSSSIYTYNYDLPSIETDQGWTTTSGTSTIHNTRFPGFFRGGGTSIAEYEGTLGTMKLTSTSGIEIQREVAAVSVSCYASWEVVDWIGIPYDTYTPLPTSDSMVVSIETFDFTMEEKRKYLNLTKGQDVNNCVPFISLKGYSTAGYPYRMKPAVSFFENNRVFLQRYSNTGTLDVFLQVVEFNPSKVRVQSGDYYTSSTTLNATVSGVDTSKTFVIFYPSFESSDARGYVNMWRTYFTSSTNLTFNRYTATGLVNIYYYVVESLDDSFTVEWLTQEGSGSSYTSTPTQDVDTNTFVYSSHSSSDPNSGYPDRWFKQIYTSTENDTVIWNRYTASSTIYAKTQVIHFNSDQIKQSLKRRYYFGSGDASITISLLETYNIALSLVLPGHSWGMSHTNGISIADIECGFHKQALASDGTQIDIIRTSAEISYGMVQIIEFVLPTHIFGGTITENEVPVDRVVRGYRADTGEFVGETTSSGGAWELTTTYSGAHYVVCLDDEDGFDYNELIYGRMLPATISG